jgi:hypothetical protein
MKLSDDSTSTPSIAIEDADDGIVHVTFVTADVDVAGKAELEIRVTDGTGGTQDPLNPIPFFIRTQNEEAIF